MLKLIRILFKDRSLIVAIGITIFIGYLSLIKMPTTNVGISNLDKVYHIIAYFTLTLFWLLSFPIAVKMGKVKYLIATACVIYGIVVEVLQTTFTAYRTASLLDVLANTVGVFVALLIINSVYKKIDAI